MKGFLLDTNIVSMLAPTRIADAAPFVAWLERMDSDRRVFLSVVTVHEIEKGIALLERKGAKAKAAGLKGWLVGLVAAFDDRILPFDIEAASIAGRLEAEALSVGHDPGMADAMIAGIATLRHLRVITRNTKHFVPFGISVSTPEAFIGEN